MQLGTDYILFVGTTGNGYNALSPSTASGTDEATHTQIIGCGSHDKPKQMHAYSYNSMHTIW
jgi:hypothetical protein